jgi:hypothetical protein
MVLPSFFPSMTIPDRELYFSHILVFYGIDFSDEIESCYREVGTNTRGNLIFCITGKYSEYDWHIIGEIEIHDTTRGFMTDIVEVRRISSDDYSDGDDEIICLRLDKSTGKSWKLECSWNRVGIDIPKSMRFEKFSILPLYLTRVWLIELGYHQSDTDIWIDSRDISKFCFIVRHREKLRIIIL